MRQSAILQRWRLLRGAVCFVPTLCLTGAILLVATESTVSAEAQLGLIVGYSGQVSITRGVTAIPVRNGASIETGEKVTTDSRGRVSVQLLSGDRLTLGPATAATLDWKSAGTSSAGPVEVTLESGILRIVTPGARSTNVRLRTANASIEPRMGKIDTSYFADESRRGFAACKQFTDIAVLDGEAQIAGAPGSPQEQRVSVRSGYATSVPCHVPPLPAGPLGIVRVATLSESDSQSTSFLYTFFHGTSSSVEQEDFDGKAALHINNKTATNEQPTLRSPKPIPLPHLNLNLHINEK